MIKLFTKRTKTGLGEHVINLTSFAVIYQLNLHA